MKMTISQKEMSPFIQQTDFSFTNIDGKENQQIL